MNGCDGLKSVTMEINQSGLTPGGQEGCSWLIETGRFGGCRKIFIKELLSRYSSYRTRAIKDAVRITSRSDTDPHLPKINHILVPLVICRIETDTFKCLWKTPSTYCAMTTKSQNERVNYKKDTGKYCIQHPSESCWRVVRLAPHSFGLEHDQINLIHDSTSFYRIK